MQTRASGVTGGLRNPAAECSVGILVHSQIWSGEPSVSGESELLDCPSLSLHLWGRNQRTFPWLHPHTICPSPSPQALSSPFPRAWNTTSVVKGWSNTFIGIPLPCVISGPASCLSYKVEGQRRREHFQSQVLQQKSETTLLKKSPGPLVLVYGQERKRKLYIPSLVGQEEEI